MSFMLYLEHAKSKSFFPFCSLLKGEKKTENKAWDSLIFTVPMILDDKERKM